MAMTELEKLQKRAMDAAAMAKTQSDAAKASSDAAQETAMGLVDMQTGNQAGMHADAAKKAYEAALAAYNMAKMKSDAAKAAFESSGVTVALGGLATLEGKINGADFSGANRLHVSDLVDRDHGRRQVYGQVQWLLLRRHGGRGRWRVRNHLGGAQERRGLRSLRRRQAITRPQ